MDIKSIIKKQNIEKVILFGAGKRGRNVCSKLKEWGITVLEIWDNGNINTMDDIPVKKPRMWEALSEKPDRVIISMDLFYKNECIQQCLDMKVPLERIDVYTCFDKMVLLDKYHSEYSEEIEKYIEYIRKNDLAMINEPYVKDYNNMSIEIHKDSVNGLFYADYKGKKLYFKRSFSRRRCEMYMKNILLEQDWRSPHCYLDNNFTLELEYNCVLDCGAAEGFFALDCIEAVERVVIAECDKEWIEALQYTFKDYGNKVTIVAKKISDIDSEDSITIDTLDEIYNINFIKMDIEGYERYAIDGMKNYVQKNKNNRAVVCAYHRPEDATEFEKSFSENGYGPVSRFSTK